MASTEATLQPRAGLTGRASLGYLRRRRFDRLMTVLIAGTAALAVGILVLIMIPIVARTVEEILALVPQTLREASLALGVPYWRTVLQVVLPAAKAGVITGVILSLARAAGETAPLLLTALGNQFFSFDLL